ncbi:MAG: ABC transporter permease [Acidimicrobiales bacterium]
MLTFLGRRVAYSLLVMVGVLFIVNALVLVSGDPARAMLPLDAGPEQVDRLRDELGLDRPLPVQFGQFMGRAVQGDFGYSHRHSRPALDVVLERLPATVQLGAAGLGVALLVGLPLGAVSALRKGTWIDHVARSIAAFGQAVPAFWLGLMLILFFGVQLGWFPISGRGDWRYLVLPAITVALPSIPPIVRIFRSSLIGVLERDYVRTARAKGLSSTRVFRKHVVRNAALPVLTVVGFEIGSILSGALIAEVIFAYPGMARLAYEAVVNRNLAVIQAFVFLVSAIVLITNMLIDLSYAALDPRVRVR